MSEQMPTDQKVWCMTDQRINDLQADSIDRVIERCRHAHFTDLRIRTNGNDEWVQADWLKHLRRVTEPIDAQRLMAFYDVDNITDLIRRQSEHIARLQAKLPPMRDEFPRTPREG